ncbi:helix-turn-helix domain-containing protein [Arcticibacter svalbardensis]|uniref:helix-turn-helix domain-containing protein n=1 Tax=Arcticibacter svalbardensis TaxID=1288027 RepID=UPI001F3F4F75|nr:AraC family transcriptional regulator [Arcticibacter svalbardensis]
MGKDSIILIPPHTSFSTHLKSGLTGSARERVSGRKMGKTDSLQLMMNMGKIDHLFIHFNLGFPHDYVRTQIYSMACTTYLLEYIKCIKEYCLKDSDLFPFLECLKIQELITHVLLELPESIWEARKLDNRINNTIQFIIAHLPEKLSNEMLAERINMATNSFSRLFKVNIGMSVQQYILKKKVELSCNLIHHSNDSIDELAYVCGFSDRLHFTKTFKHVTGITPTIYKKQFILM